MASTRSQPRGSPLNGDVEGQYNKLAAVTKAAAAQKKEKRRKAINTKGASEVTKFLSSIPFISGNDKFHACMGRVFEEQLDANQSIQDEQAWMKNWKISYVIVSKSEGGFEELTPILMKQCGSDSIKDLCCTSLTIESLGDDQATSEQKLLDMYNAIMERLSEDRTTENQTMFDTAFVKHGASAECANLQVVNSGNTVEGFWRSPHNDLAWMARIQTADERSWIEFYDGSIYSTHFDVSTLTLTITYSLQKTSEATLQHDERGDGTLVWVVEDGDCSDTWYRIGNLAEHEETSTSSNGAQELAQATPSEEVVENTQAKQEAIAKKKARERLLEHRARKSVEVPISDWSLAIGDLVAWIAIVGE